MTKNNDYFLVRHGKTVSNEEGIFMGTLDIPLSPNGITEALALHEQIREMRFDVAYSSPLSRALNTAYLVLGMARPVGKNGTNYPVPFYPDYPLSFYPNDQITFNIPFLIEPRIAERSFGDLQGVVKEGYTKDPRFAKYAGRDVTKSFHDKADGGESFTELEMRLTVFF